LSLFFGLSSELALEAGPGQYARETAQP
jgi:hypothetical protein